MNRAAKMWGVIIQKAWVSSLALKYIFGNIDIPRHCSASECVVGNSTFKDLYRAYVMYIQCFLAIIQVRHPTPAKTESLPQTPILDIKDIPY